jgi:transcriptional regulator with XRE-family HTH domain
MITTLRKRITDILNAKGWSVQYFADLVEEKYEDISADTVKNICRGKTADPRVSTLMAMSKVLGHSINCLMGECPHSKEEREIINCYRKSGEHGKNYILSVARYEASATKAEETSFDKHKIECLFPRGEIRKGIVYDMCERERIETHIKDVFVAVQMTDNDLAPIFFKGDILLFENRFPENGEIAAFFRKDRAYIRKFYEENGQYRLKSLYPQYEDIILKKMDDILYIGTCISVVRE